MVITRTLTCVFSIVQFSSHLELDPELEPDDTRYFEKIEPGHNPTSGTWLTSPRLGYSENVTLNPHGRPLFERSTMGLPYPFALCSDKVLKECLN